MRQRGGAKWLARALQVVGGLLILLGIAGAVAGLVWTFKFSEQTFTAATTQALVDANDHRVAAQTVPLSARARSSSVVFSRCSGTW